MLDMYKFMITVFPLTWPLMDGQMQPKGTVWSNAGIGYQMVQQTNKLTETNLVSGLEVRPSEIKKN